MLNILYRRIKSTINCLCILSKGGKISLPNINVDGVIFRCSKKGKMEIGADFSARRNLLINISDNGRLLIGNNVFINDDTKINVRECVVIGNNVLMGQNILIYDHDHDYKSDDIKHKFVSAPVNIGNNVWIGSDAIILKGCTIGDNCVVGAGSRVIKDIPANSLYYNKLGDAIIKPIEYSSNEKGGTNL